MSQFNEGEKAKEERRRYQKTVQVLTLFILSYIAQWLAPIIYKSWAFVMPPPNVLVSKILIKLNVRFLITARKPSLGQGNIFTGVCLSTVSLSRVSLSRGVSIRGFLSRGISAGSLCRGVSVQEWGLCPGVSVQGLCPGVGSLSRRGTLSRGSLSRGSSVQGVSVYGWSLSRRSMLGRPSLQ